MFYLVNESNKVIRHDAADRDGLITYIDDTCNVDIGDMTIIERLVQLEKRLTIIPAI